MYKTAAADSPQQTAAFAAGLAPLLAPPLRLYLSGDLGAGKTFFTQALLAALGETAPVRSPSYALVYSYAIGAVTVHHFDCYRLQGAPAGEDLLELLEENALCVLEWPERAGDLPPADLHLHFNCRADDARGIDCRARSAAGEALLARLP